jgi:hypothetical protein
MIVLRHILAVLCEMFSITPIVTEGGSILWPPRFSPHSNHLDFYLLGHHKTLVYAAPVDNEEAHGIVDACQTILNYAGIFERMWRSMMRRVEGALNLMEDVLNIYY